MIRVLTVVLVMLFGASSAGAGLVPDGEYRLLSDIHLVDGIPYKGKHYNAVVEIPAGSIAKWEANKETGHLEWEFKHGKPREVKYLGYPGNYGYIPQTLLDADKGGDGDPLDVIVLGKAEERGSVKQVKIIGAIKLIDGGDDDHKLIAVTTDGPFEKIDSMGEMFVKFPGVIHIVRLWFEGYKGPGEMMFAGYMKRREARALVEDAHKSWLKKNR